MGTGANERVSPGRVVLIFAVLLAVWLGFQFFPRRKEPPPALPPVKAESKHRSTGLADNPDWMGLPELFAVWADKVEWNEGKAHFAYWHPGSRTYAYCLEAVRQDGSYRFREASPQRLSEEGYQAEDGEDPVHLAHRERETSTHPFVFFSRLKPVRSGPYMPVPAQPAEPAKPAVPVELKPPPLVISPPAK